MSSNGSPTVSTLRELLHEVRNSLSLVSGHAQYLLLKTPGEAPSELRIIRREAERAVSLINLVPDSLAELALPAAPLTDADGGGDADRPPSA